MNRRLLLLACVCPGAAAADDRTAIERAIRGQLDAFARDDAAAAYAAAAPGIRALFPSPDRFMAMVRGGYAPLIRPREVVFRPPRTADGMTIQPLAIRAADGTAWLATYTMERQPDGSWRIAGCTLARIEEAAS